MSSLIKQCLTVLLIVFATLATAETSQRDFQQVLKSGELRIGVSLYPPWVMRSKSGQLMGSEIDMGNRLAADMGVEARFGEYEWQQLIPALNKGEIDIIISGMAIKPSRALKVNFSMPYGDAGIGLAANTELTREFKSLDELKQSKVKIAVIKKTVSEELAGRLFAKATLVKVATQAEAEELLLQGKVHALVASNPLPDFIALKHPKKVDVPLNTPLLSFKEGMAINKGDVDFLNFINSWVIARTADAWIPSTRAYWLESLDWKDQVN